jgi:hypothetical protein
MSALSVPVMSAMARIPQSSGRHARSRPVVAHGIIF